MCAEACLHAALLSASSPSDHSYDPVVAPHCGKCRQIMPFVNELSEEFPEVTFAKFDTTDEALSELSDDLGVQAIPAFRFFKGGKEVLEPVTGYKKKLLRAAVEDLQKQD